MASPEALEARYANRQLAVNRCLLAIRQACRVNLGATLREWTADPHARVRCQVGRSWRTVHPDAVTTIEVDGRHYWMYLVVDRGTAELRCYGLKLRRYACFYLAGTWRREYARFPEVRIGTAHRPRVRRMLAEVEDVPRSFRLIERDALENGLVVVGHRALSMLRRYLHHRPPGLGRASDRLFVTSSGRALDPAQVSHIVRRLRRRRGIPRLYSHRLRQTFAVHFLRNGGNLLTRQGLLGHASLATTTRYLTLATGDLVEAHRRSSPLDNL